ncbi:MAG: class I SAM-dependent methyltransferase [Saprospirales bacterium]|jgi:SAM-dependent methyltransferase|nr:class I SAM-dependent methyltransferase [Saprospirales bacterium]MBK8922031.1 class I SAM-dependent methyltransferase [Saprospirales bacterium]
MMRASVLLLLATFLPVLWACNGDQTAGNADAPGMTRETPPPTPAKVEHPEPSKRAGNFENLVADYESKDRVIWQKPGIVIALLGDLKGKTVADIGAGTGYFTFRMVPLADKVIGVDIDPRFISFMDSVKVRLPEQYRNRFESRLAKPDNPMLTPEEADAVIIVNTYGYIVNRVKYLRTLARGMTTGAELLIIDFKKNNLPVGPDDVFKVALSQVEQELGAAGFEVARVDNETLDYQYIVLANKK